MIEDWKQRLLNGTRETAERLNELNTFMAGDIFPTLLTVEKDLMYEQQRAMSSLVQILGKRLILAGVRFTHKDK